MKLLILLPIILALVFVSTSIAFAADGTEPSAKPEPRAKPELLCGAGSVFNESSYSCVSDGSTAPVPELIPTVKPIPQWVKGVFAFYINGQINDTELLDAIKFLIEQKILVVN